MPTIRLQTAADFTAAHLSYYTLSRLADALSCVYPMHYIPVEAKRTNRVCVLTVDDLGNFVSVEWIAAE